jgi:dTDP-4-amino-4,6-dideoxygalactose transaminase
MVQTDDAARLAFDTWLAAFTTQPDFAFIKITHGFWERLVRIERSVGWPRDDAGRAAADAAAGRVGEGFFADGFVEELIALLGAMPDDEALRVGVALGAWRGDARIVGTPRYPDDCAAMVDRLLPAHARRTDGLVLKTAVETGAFLSFMTALAPFHVIVLGPALIAGFGEFARLQSHTFIEIHPTQARRARRYIESALAAAIKAAPVGRPVCVLLQAGSLSAWLVLRLRPRCGQVRWVDGGLALSLCAPDDILGRNWGRVWRADIVRSYNRWTGANLAAQETLMILEAARVLEDEIAQRRAAPPAIAATGPRLSGFRENPVCTVDLIERKVPDFGAVERLLALPAATNQWTNFGPLDELLSTSLHEYAGFSEELAVVPCANGTAALEVMAILHEIIAGRKLRWAASAFAYFNVSRGQFADTLLVDCTAQGLLDLSRLAAIDPESYDGLVVTNNFGFVRDFAAYEEFAAARGKYLIIDNAAGFANGALQNTPWQSFSFHQTKPFGVGEGGAMLLPRAHATTARHLIAHGKTPDAAVARRSVNAKLSEIAAAFILDRLRRAPGWVPLYRMQLSRITELAEDLGFTPLIPRTHDVIAMTYPVLAPADIALARLRNPHLTLAKSYAPLGDFAQAHGLYRRLVNIPCHPDVAQLSRATLTALLSGLLHT